MNITDRILGEASKVRPPTDLQLTCPLNAYRYARDVVNGRWPEGEATIAKDPRSAHYYARDFIKGRFPEAEATIAKSPRSAYDYAKYVIKGRFPEAEQRISKDPDYSIFYLELFPQAKLEWAMNGWLDWLDL